MEVVMRKLWMGGQGILLVGLGTLAVRSVADAGAGRETVQKKAETRVET
jgi:hypothetical protein